jgi:D-alanyl-lipoteichoic acid acyltransferase DltB (MBOAT superfamily)
LANWKIVWNLVFSSIFLTALFGASVLKIWLLVTIHYIALKSTKSIASPIFSWVFGIGILFLNHAFHGYKFASISLDWLDSYNGVGMRWQTSFNFCVLRMISFSMDYYWMHRGTIQFENHLTKCKDCDSFLCEKGRIEKSRSERDYNYLTYMIYITYAPLYLAGPIISFNNFLEQVNKTPKTITVPSTIKYGLKWIGMVLLMEAMMHLFHVVAIKDTKSWQGFTSLQIFTLGYFNLNLIWLKVFCFNDSLLLYGGFLGYGGYLMVLRHKKI